MGLSAHATHVTGTICQNKTNSPISRGMAFDASVWANDWGNDTLEAIEQAQEGLLVSNHSYGFGAFDAQGVLQLPVFYFGAYIQTSRNWDLIMNQFPNYLMVTAAGNDRQSQASMTNKGGYDIISGTKTTKNNITVGAINNMPTYTNSSSPVMSSFSSWGPCDDGRIKPDIVAKGVGVVSTTSTGATSATTTMSGTSMASPSIAGGLLLLQQHYNNVNGNFMLAATLKGLALHTASEAGTAVGPDYAFGWGVLDCTAAANLISKNGLTSRIQELTLNSGQTIVMNIKAGNSALIPLMASISWNDPAGATNPGVIDSRIPVLVNDLDIKLSKVEDNFFPWKLDPANPANAATTGVNNVDPFEKIQVNNATGTYTLTISHKGTLAAPQKFSLITSGELNDFSLRSALPTRSLCANQSAVYSIQHITSNANPTNLTVTGLPAGVTAVLTANSINANGNFGLTLSNFTNVSAGKYIFQVNGLNGTFSNSVDLEVNVFGTVFTSIQNQLPVNEAINIPLVANLSWANNSNAQSYEIQIARNVNFTFIFQTGTTTTNSFVTNQLNPNSNYFWRVKSINNCGQSTFSAARQFKTLDLNCASPLNSTAAAIAATANTVVTSQIVFANSLITNIFDIDVELNITHTYVQDMTLKLTSPQGTVVVLQAEACGEENDINAIYDDSGNEITCSAIAPAISGRVKPFQMLSLFNGENPNGTWTLTVQDPWNGDGGTLNNWKINICSQANLSTTDFESKNAIAIYPNPAQNILNFKVSESIEVTNAEIFDISGKNLNAKLLDKNQFDIANLQSGVYFIKFYTDGKTITKKFIKQ
jgi:subtilisin-like proprotein convertase family protein